VSEQGKNPNPFDQLLEAIRLVVREEIASLKTELNGGHIAEKDWLRADEAARLYGLPKTWFEERGRAGDIARTKPGRYTLFQRRDVESYLERNKGTDWPKRKRKKKQIGLTSSNSDTT
jgi:excisionase family DNA binding protein